MAFGVAAQQILVGGMKIVVAGGVESVSLLQNAHQNVSSLRQCRAADTSETGVRWGVA
jgi:acetyl-CoA acetyltransferase